MNHTGRAAIELGTAADALAKARALAPDNDGLMQARANGNVIRIEARADSVLGLLRTLDDALACLRAAGVD